MNAIIKLHFVKIFHMEQFDVGKTMRWRSWLEANSAKRTRHINMRHFDTKDNLDRMEFELEHL